MEENHRSNQSDYSLPYNASTRPEESISERSTTILVPAPQNDAQFRQASGHVLIPGVGSAGALEANAPLVQFDRVGRRSEKLFLGIAVGYATFLIVLVLLAGSSLYGWSRDYILRTPTLIAADVSALENISASDGATSNADLTTGDDTSAKAFPAIDPNGVEAINILLMGTDARPEDTDAARTDTLILLTLNPQTRTAGMLSLPRDLYVPIHRQGYEAKINMAYVIGEDERYPGGGAQLTMDTVSDFVQQPIDYYVRLNFHGFIELVDLIGGIDVLVPHEIHDEEYPTEDYGYETFHLDAGLQHLDGETALKFARTRNIDNDYGRAKRQQQVIRAVVDKVLAVDMIPTLLPKLPTIFYTMRSSVDTNIPMTKQIELAQLLRSVAPREIRQEVLDNRYGEETYSEYGEWILRADPQKKEAILKRFFADPGPTPVGSDTTDLRWVRVEILNGTNQPGIAAKARDLLEARGWQITTIDDADRKNYSQTLLINYSIPADLMKQIQTDLGLATDQAILAPKQLNQGGTAPVDVRIIIGNDLLPELQK